MGWGVGTILISVLVAIGIATTGTSAHHSPREAFRRPKVVPFPVANRFTRAKYDLGKKLFFDPLLSKDHTMACASCHRPEIGWGDGRATGRGKNGLTLSRRVPHLWNLAWTDSFFWDGRAATLEEQALGPIQNPNEMGLPLPELMARLKQNADYRTRFNSVFPREGLTPETVGKAIATFERTLISPKAPFDEWVEGKEHALTARQKRGFALFTGKANCVQCHTGWNFTNGSFADVGLLTTDKGRGLILNDADADFAFKAPTLRNLKGRNFFFHDGSITTLEAVVENYDRGGAVHRPTAQLWLKPLQLTADEKNDLVHFLYSLAGEKEDL